MSTPTTNITFRTSASLMEDYRLGTELTAKTTITQLTNAEGASELFYTGSDGKGGTIIYNVWPDSTSGTGWSVTQIIPDTVPGQLSGGMDNGVFTLVFIGPDTSNPDIHYSKRDASGNWSVWTVVDPTPVFNNLTPPVYVQNITAEVVNSALQLAAVLCDPTGQLSIWRVGWNADTTWLQLGDVDSPFLDICITLPWGAGVLGAQINGASPSAMDLMFFSIDGATTATVAAKQYFKLADSALQAPDADGAQYSGIFLYDDGLIDASRKVSFIDCSVATPAAAQIDATLSCAQLVAVAAGANPISLFALDLSMRLNVLGQNPDGSWPQPVELGEQFSSITAGLNADRAPLLFAVNAAGSNLTWMLQEAGSDDGEWSTQEIAAQQQTIEKIEVYGTTFTLMDGEGSLLQNAALTVTSPETTPISWREQTTVIGPGVSRSLTTDANGRITLYAPTGSINTAKLLFSAPQSSPSGGHIPIDPDDNARAQLEKLTVEQVKSLLPPEFQQDATQVQQAITTAMSYAPAGGRSVVGLKGRRSVPSGGRTPDWRRPIDPASGRIPHWRFSMRNGRATFSELTLEEAAALRTAFFADAPDGFFDFDWLGDIVDAVGNAVESAFDCVVSAVNDVVTATINCVINGITYAFDAAVDTIERAFEIAESIFNSVKVFFQQLFDFLAWLLSGARQDIWNTKVVFEGLINQSFPALATLCQQGKSAAVGFFAGLKPQVAAGFAVALAAVGSDTFNYDDATTSRAASLGLSPGDFVEFFLDAAVKANWLFDKVSSVLGSNAFTTSVPQSIIDAFNNFYNLLTPLVQGISNQFSNFISYLSSIATSPGNLMSSTLAALLNAVENLVFSVLDLLDAATQDFFQMAIAFLQAVQTAVGDQEVPGFFLGAIYNYVLNPGSSEDFTVTRFVAMACAFPTTVIYRLVTGSAPFSANELGQLAAADANVYKVIGGYLTLIYSVVDLRLDLVVPQSAGPAPDLPYFLAISSFMPVLINGLLSPGAAPFQLLTWDTDLNKSKNLFWCGKWFPIGFATVYKVCTGFRSGPRGNPMACTVLCALGTSVLGLGIWKGIQESQAGVATFSTWFTSLAGPLVTVAKPLRFAGAYGEVGLIAIDAVFDVGVGAVILDQNN